MGLMTAAGALSVAWAAPNTQVIRPPQQATTTTPKSTPTATRPTAVKPSAPTGAKRVTVRGTATRQVTAPSAAASEEAKPFAIDPARPLADQLVAVGVDANDARAAAQAVAELKGASLSAGNTGRAALIADGAKGTPHRLQSLQIFGATGIVADVERSADGKFTGKTATAVAGTQAPAAVRPASLSTDPSSADAGQDDPRMWSTRDGQSLRTAKSLRDIAQSTVGLRRISANGDANVALANAGIETGTARSAAQALAAVAPANLDRRSANIEVVNGRTGDGQVRLLTATIYDRNARGQVWWFAPRNQPEGFFDERGNRVGDTGMTLPIEGSHISSPFGTRRWGRWAAFHNGLDVAGQYGTPIIAAADGVVDYTGWYYNYGKTVRIVHGDSLATSYSHMSNFAAGVGPGTRVRKGQVIGYVGSTGRSTGPHLHFCVLVDGQFVNPAPYVAGGGGGSLTGQDLVSFRDWQRTTAGMARGGSTRRTSNDPDGYNRL